MKEIKAFRNGYTEEHPTVATRQLIFDIFAIFDNYLMASISTSK